jgi:hypothetical protein
MSHDALISELSSGLEPVRRRSALVEASLVLTVGASELAVFLAVGLMRPDMGQAIGTPYMWWKLASLALLVAISWTTALRSLSPVMYPHRGLMLAVLATMLAMLVGFLIDPGVAGDASLARRIEPLHGLGCAVAIVILSLPPAAILAILMRRAAPSHPEGSALAIGLAAGSWGAFVFSFCCPSNDPVYVAVWYGAGCAIVAAAARWLIPRGFRL